MRLWPREEAIEEAMARALADGEARRLHAHDLTWDGFVDQVARAAGVRLLDEVTERLALREACVRATAGTTWARVAVTRGFIAAAARFVADAERAGLRGGELRHACRQAAAAPDADTVALDRVERLAAVLEQFQRLTQAAGSSRTGRLAAARRHLEAGGALPPLLEDALRGEIVVRPRLAWEPAEVAFVIALAERAGRAGGRVRVELPYARGRDPIDGGLEVVRTAIEARADVGALELDSVDLVDASVAGVRELVEGLHAPLGAEAAAPAQRRVGLVSAPGEIGELRALAASARALVDAGVPPEEIAVAARAPAALGDDLAEELARVGLPLDDRRGPPLTSSPVAQLALALCELPERAWAREDVIAVIASRYVDGPLRLPGVARATGLVDLGPAGRAKLAHAPAGGAELAAQLGTLMAPIEALPAEAPLRQHATALAAALAALGVPQRARRYDPGPADDHELQPRIDRALARDQAAMDALDELLVELPRAAVQLGLHARQVSRAHFVELLADLMAQTPLRAIGARGGAVKLVHLRDLAARDFAHVFVPRLVEGAAPARGGDDGVYGERERRALNAALGARVVATTRGDAGEAERTPYETLMLVAALAAAREGVTLSHARAAGGRPVTRSPFLDEAVRAAPWLVPLELPAQPLPLADAARAPADLLARAALEAYADPSLRLPGAAEPTPPSALYAAVQRALPARLARVATLARIERARWRFFARADQAAPPFAGGVGRHASMPARAAAPMGARGLEILANCRFAFFADKVLGVGEMEEAGQAPDQREVGTLAHAALEKFYRRRQAAGRLPVVADDEEQRELDACLDEAFAEKAAEQPGHPILRAIERQRLGEQLWRLVEHESTHLEEMGGGVPTYFELKFGEDTPDSLPALVIGPEDARVSVRGRIDRVDLLPGGKGLVVLDYKLGRKESQSKKLAEGQAAVTQLQLPIYALAARAGLTGTGAVVDGASVDAAFVSLRDGMPTKLLSKTLKDPPMATVLAEQLPARLDELATQLHAGDFAIDPEDCAYCAYRTVCRVVALVEDEDDK